MPRLSHNNHKPVITPITYDGVQYYIRSPSGVGHRVAYPMLIKFQGQNIEAAPHEYWATMVCAGMCEEDGRFTYDVRNKNDIEEVLSFDGNLVKYIGEAVMRLAKLIVDEDGEQEDESE